MRVRLERPSPAREREFLDAVRTSSRLHGRFVTAPGKPQEYRDYLRRTRRKNQESFFVVLREDDSLVGVINVNEIVRYALQSGTLGYYAFAPHAGNGLMREGLALVIDRAFRVLGLHRLEANIQPANARSSKLVQSLGFRREGLSLRYLKINGRWRDHERWAIVADEWQSSAPALPATARLPRSLTR